ncbi:hypothetical protein [uncultured Nostoc sp.]|uniref:hypothetical protein n=1 Tax=uncultured Nostoc sp. TaxID=340711 RepID=UPI0035CBCE3E
MFGFDGDTEGLKIILERIVCNYDSGKLSHKEVRAYARCMLAIFENLSIDIHVEAEIKFLIAALSASGIAHYDRSFIASRILKLLEENARSKVQKMSSESF